MTELEALRAALSAINRLADPPDGVAPAAMWEALCAIRRVAEDALGRGAGPAESATGDA